MHQWCNVCGRGLSLQLSKDDESRDFETATLEEKTVWEQIAEDPAAINDFPYIPQRQMYRSYSVIHQLAYHGNWYDLEDLMDFKGSDNVSIVDLGIKSKYGENILEIANSKWHFEFLKKVRVIMEAQYDAMFQGGIKYNRRRERLLEALHPAPFIVMRGLESNIPASGGFPASVPSESKEWMMKCRRLTAEKMDGKFQDPWVLARTKLAEDPELTQLVDWFRALLPVHRTNKNALANFLRGGALMGTKGFDLVVPPLNGATQESVHAWVDGILFNMSDAISTFTRASDIQFGVRKSIGEYCRGRFLVNFHSEDLGELNVIKTLVFKALGETVETIEARAESEFKNKLGGGRDHGLPLPEGAGGDSVKKRLDDMVATLAARVCELIKVSQGGLGIGQLVDRVLGTNHNLFAMLGPNTEDEYGGVAFIFTKDVLYHPDSNMTPQAMSAYLGHDHIAGRRPWVAAPQVDPAKLPRPDQIGWEFDPAMYMKDAVQNRSLPLREEDMGIPVPAFCDTTEGSEKTEYLGLCHSIYAAKREMVHAGLTPDYIEVIARDVCATVRTALTGARPPYEGRPPPGLAAGWEPEISEEYAVGSYSKEDCCFDSMKLFHMFTEGHGHVEVHLPRCITREAIEHIIIKSEELDQLYEVDKIALDNLVEGIVLPDGREFQIAWEAPDDQPDHGHWVSMSPKTLTVVYDTQEWTESEGVFAAPSIRPVSSMRPGGSMKPGASMKPGSSVRPGVERTQSPDKLSANKANNSQEWKEVENTGSWMFSALTNAQIHYFELRSQMLRTAKSMTADRLNFEQASLLREPQGLCFRTPSFLQFDTIWLPCTPEDESLTGLGVSFESNTETGVMLSFAESIGKEPSDRYCISIGQEQNSRTLLMKFKGNERQFYVEAFEGEDPDSSFMESGPRGNGMGATWTRYWAAVARYDKKAFVVFGRGDIPNSIEIKQEGKYQFVPLPGDEVLSSPIMVDDQPLQKLGYVGCSCKYVSACFRNLVVGQAPKVYILG